MDFKDISLTFRERRALKRSALEYVPESPVHHRLIRLGLEIQEKRLVPGSMPKPTGRVMATEKGIDYLAYYRKERRDLWLKNAWIPIIVSIVTTVAVNYILPMLPSTIEWLARIFG